METNQKEHRVDPSYRSSTIPMAVGLICLGSCGMLLPFLPPSRPSDQFVTSTYGTIFFMAGGIGLLFFGISFYCTAVGSRIVTSPTEIIYYTPGLELHSPWVNLERIESWSLSGKKTMDRIILRQPGEQKRAWWFKPWKTTPEEMMSLSMFGDWRRSELGQEIKKYAPHLVAQG